MDCFTYHDTSVLRVYKDLYFFSFRLLTIILFEYLWVFLCTDHRGLSFWNPSKEGHASYNNIMARVKTVMTGS